MMEIVQLEDDPQSEQKDLNEELLTSIIAETARDYSQFFTTDVTIEESRLMTAINEMTGILESTCTTLAALRQQNTTCHQELVTHISQQTASLKGVYSYIDLLDSLVTTVRTNLVDLEQEVSRAEELLSGDKSSVKKFFKSTLSSFLSLNPGSGGSGALSRIKSSSNPNVFSRSNSSDQVVTRDSSSSGSTVVRPHSSNLCPYEPIQIFSTEYFFSGQNTILDDDPTLDSQQDASHGTSPARSAQHNESVHSHSEDVSNEELNV